MGVQGQRELQLLNEVEHDSFEAPRSLVSKRGVALDLPNLSLKRLAYKDYIKIATIDLLCCWPAGKGLVWRLLRR